MSDRAQHLAGTRSFAQVAIEWLPRIKSLNALKVFIVLCSHADRETSKCFPSKGTMARAAAIDTREVARALRSLESIGAIRVEFRDGSRSGVSSSSIYTISPPSRAYDGNETAEKFKGEVRALVAGFVAAGVAFEFTSKNGVATVQYRSKNGINTKAQTALEPYVAAMPWQLFHEYVQLGISDALPEKRRPPARQNSRRRHV